MGRLELPRVAPLEPKSSASTNSATFAQTTVRRTIPAGAALPQDTVTDFGDTIDTEPQRGMVGRPGLEPGTR